MGVARVWGRPAAGPIGAPFLVASLQMVVALVVSVTVRRREPAVTAAAQ